MTTDRHCMLTSADPIIQIVEDIDSRDRGGTDDLNIRGRLSRIEDRTNIASTRYQAGEYKWLWDRNNGNLRRATRVWLMDFIKASEDFEPVAILSRPYPLDTNTAELHNSVYLRGQQ